MEYKELREEAYEANMEVSRLGLALFTWGNVSAFDRKSGVFAIKPSGVPYETLAVEDIVVIEIEGGRVAAGALRPSSDTPTHLALYRAWGEKIGGVTHTHSTYATAWAQAGHSIAVYGTTHADFSATPVPCVGPLEEAQVERDYEGCTGQLITEGFTALGYKPAETPAALVKGHGPFVWGKTALASVHNARILEETAKMAFLSLSIRHSMSLPSAAETLPSFIQKKHYKRKHGPQAYYGQKGL
jgi:L-ribulose-5-phosphate 4-epimerase